MQIRAISVIKRRSEDFSNQRDLRRRIGEMAIWKRPPDLWGMDNAEAISWLRCHSEGMARRLRLMAIGFALIAVVLLLVLGILAIFYEHLFYERQAANTSSVAWAVARVSVGILVATLMLLFSRVVWNYSNVWLGRAGTLEDLILALKLLGVTREEKFKPEQSKELRDIVESLERLRRGFEGDLLKVPSFEVKVPSSIRTT
jgi:hypothetical protein